MAKSKKDKASKKALSGGNLYSQEAVSSLLQKWGRLPDLDEVLRKAGIARHRLAVLLDDDEIAQTTETRLDALLGQPIKLEPSDTPQALLIKQELDEWFHEIASSSLNGLFFGYSVQEAVYVAKGNYIGLLEIKEKPMEWFEPKNDGRLLYRQDCSGTRTTMANNVGTEYAALFKGVDTYSGDKIVVEIWRLQLSPETTFDLINEDFSSYDLTGDALADSSKSNNAELGPFGVIERFTV
ncbi:hypothetical protein I2F62_05570 [Acinetobacter sp. MD2(2019)]|nr:hypothetical protein [Acinetobacter sp. MD2(2019)]MEB3753814.1 hypothetical protein [Acinetobacter sp. MD2(2019)]